jgi:multidrug efflux system membrane fusion protein
VRLRASFDNKNNRLFPNQFVNIQILVDTLHQATVVPTAAIQHTQHEDFVYIINANNTVTSQTVVMGPTIDTDTVIKKGISPGQTVVINGADKLMNGSKIFIQESKSPSPKKNNNSSSSHSAT